MKQIQLFFIFSLTLSIVSCSSNDDHIESNNFINPPDWIIGTWLDETDPDWAQIGGFQFTNDNLLDISSDNTTVVTNLKEGLQDGVNAGVISVDEVITSNKYELKILSNGTLTSNYEFSKGTNNQTIIYTLSSTRNVILTKQ